MNTIGDYDVKMDLLVNSFRSTVVILEFFSEGELSKILDTINRAEGVSPFMVEPYRFGKVTDNLSYQREIVYWAQKTLSLYQKMKKEIKEKEK